MGILESRIGGSTSWTWMQDSSADKVFADGDYSRNPNDHINIRILHSGWKTQDKEDSRNHALSDPHIRVVCCAPMLIIWRFFQAPGRIQKVEPPILDLNTPMVQITEP